MYDFRHKILPDKLKNFYTICSEIHDHNNRFVSDSLHVTTIHSVKYDNKPKKYQGPRIWNELIINNPSITTIHTKQSFQYNIKKH